MSEKCQERTSPCVVIAAEISDYSIGKDSRREASFLPICQEFGAIDKFVTVSGLTRGNRRLI
jgi:hypothetical protein